MRKTEILKVQGYSVTVDEDYICLTDMAKAGNDEARAADVIRNWIRNKSTIEFLGTWEALYNPNFKVFEFEHFKNDDNLPTLSVTSWVDATDAIGIYSKMGKNGGTYAHRDIAFEFGSAISPVFKLHLIKEYQRLKELESNVNNIDWNMRRLLSKAQYHVQTDAVKKYKIPVNNIPQSKEFLAYAEEGDILNLAMFGFTARQWRESNIELAAKNFNARDFASINELAVMSSLEAINAQLLKNNIPYDKRLEKLIEIKNEQLATLERVNPANTLRKDTKGNFEAHSKKLKNGMFPVKEVEPPKELSSFDKDLTTLLNTKPPKKD